MPDMEHDDMMAFESDPSAMWSLTDDLKTVRFALPLLPLESLPEPLLIHLDFDASAVDAIIDQLTILRARMRPAPGRH